MSKARSPRDVCSTTMGTSGLMVLALFRSSVGIPAGGPETGWRRLGRAYQPPFSGLDAGWTPRVDWRRVVTNRGSRVAFRRLPARPSRASTACRAGARLLLRERARVLGEEVDGLALGQVLLELVEAPGLLEAVAQLLGRRALARGRRLQRVEQVAVAGLDPLGLDHGGDDRLALERLLGVGARLGEDVVLVAAGHLQVRLARDALVAERVDHPVEELPRARVHSVSGPSTVALATTASTTASWNSSSTLVSSA